MGVQTLGECFTGQGRSWMSVKSTGARSGVEGVPGACMVVTLGLGKPSHEHHYKASSGKKTLHDPSNLQNFTIIFKGSW